MSYQLTRQKLKSGCRIKAVRVQMKISYTMPKPVSFNRMPRRKRRKWRQLYRLLDRHERTHGKFYRQFARDVHRKLRRMKPARTCWRLDRQAAAIVKELGDKDSRRNDRFDIRDSRTYRRVERIYTSS